MIVMKRMTREGFKALYEKCRQKKLKYNTEIQFYKCITLQLVERKDYFGGTGKAYYHNATKDIIWIPNQFLQRDGTKQESANLDTVLTKWGSNRLLTAKAYYQG